MFDSVLIANRGEIACRIIRTLKRLGIRSIAVYSDADANSLHVQLADEAVRLGPANAAESYLSIDRVLQAARESGAQAIHPGYGFLAENAEFARACDAAGIVFIGPTADAIATMGDKITAKAAVETRGVPTVPGIARPGLTDDELIEAAPGIGFPVLIKPSAGGGGKGMHVVTDAAMMPDAVRAARREAAASFGDDTLFLERYILQPRHIEVQVLADEHGNVVHLGERECSLQRRHQKVIEEAPSPLIDDATRARLGQAACETARSVGYRGAGTVEFIVPADAPDDFSFMEMNTRLQVEHPVTEQVYGIDLVEQQLRIAAGEPLALRQGELVPRGHSIEARVYAEDPAAGFLPTGGPVSRVILPTGDGVRVDSALAAGDEPGRSVAIDYDPMIAKLITWGADRDDARRRLIAAIDGTTIAGFTTNLEFLRMLLNDPDVIAGDMDTATIERLQPTLTYAVPDDEDAIAAALVLRGASAGSGWQRRDGWRIGGTAPVRTELVDETGVRHVVELTAAGDGWTARAGELEVAAGVQVTDDAVRLRLGDHTRVLQPARGADGSVEWTERGVRMRFAPPARATGTGGDGAGAAGLVSPMPGTVVVVAAEPGQQVAEGDPLVVVEAMKMEHVIRAQSAGIATPLVAVGDRVERGQAVAQVLGDEPAES